MNGVTVETVASSWIEALGGLSQMYMRSVPPCCWASAAAVVWSTMAARARPVIDKRWSMRILASAPFLACAVSGERVRDGCRCLFSSHRSMDAAAGPWQARWNQLRHAPAARLVQSGGVGCGAICPHPRERPINEHVGDGHALQGIGLVRGAHPVGMVAMSECSADALEFCGKKRGGEAPAAARRLPRGSATAPLILPLPRYAT